ncbi:MAG: DNA-protecting protein DprA [Fimbriimonadaceae bacterium]|nr:DNA-protecting protein DprA [Fimbriimonadaceae bacterium]
MSPADPAAEAWLRLAALNTSARRKQRLLQHFGSPAALLAAPAAAWAALRPRDGEVEGVQRVAQLDVSAAMALLQDAAGRLVPSTDPEFPARLQAIDDPPVVLFVRGRLPAPEQPAVALVGTRRTSPYGELVAEELARDLAAAGVAVISGLAAGIDGAAHEGALRASGLTVAVLGTGVDRAYPSSHKALLERVAAEGGVVSEFLPGTGPRGFHFPLRNRLISGLAQAVVVVQAPRRSGALVTAQLAAEQNRDVLAVPGPITDSRHAGCHDLLRDGARLVRGADDILEVLNLPPAGARGSDPPDARPVPVAVAPSAGPEAAVAAACGLLPLGIDDLIEQTGLATPEVQSALVTLELKQVVRRLPGNRFVRAT